MMPEASTMLMMAIAYNFHIEDVEMLIKPASHSVYWEREVKKDKKDMTKKTRNSRDDIETLFEVRGENFNFKCK